MPFTKLWEAEVGTTTFRTNLAFAEGKLFVGSKGKVNESDPSDGVYALDAKSGRRLWHFHPQNTTDKNVVGTVYHNSRLYFGDYGGWIYALDAATGKPVWQKSPVETAGQGPVKNVPAIALRADKRPMLVLASATPATVFALEPADGKLIWAVNLLETYEDFGSCMGSPAVVDLNRDGTEDVIIGTGNNGNGRLLALSGQDGSVLWEFMPGSGIHTSPQVLRNPAGEIFVLIAESYSCLYLLAGTTGKPLREACIKNPVTTYGGISGLFGSPLLAPNGDLGVGSSWWGDEDAVMFLPMLDNSQFEAKRGNPETRTYKLPVAVTWAQTGRLSASPVLGDVMGTGGYQFVLPTESGLLCVYKSDGFMALDQKVQVYQLPGGVGTEATPLLADVTGNGMAELLLLGLDGRLRCYATKANTRSVLWGSFRGDARNTGVAGYTISPK